jgi:hypothetical protein
MTDKEAPTVFDKNMSYQDFLKTIPPEEIAASQKMGLKKKIPTYQEVLKTIAPKDKYTWTEMNEMVEREIRSVVGKMTDAIKEDIVGHFSSNQYDSRREPLNEDGHERLTITALNIFNTYLIRVLQNIVNDYKYKNGYSEHSTVIRDILQIATTQIDTYSPSHTLPTNPEWFESLFINIVQSEYIKLTKTHGSRYVYIFIQESIGQFGYLMNMMVAANHTGLTSFQIHDYQEQHRLVNYLQKKPIVALEHFGIFSNKDLQNELVCKTPFFNTSTNKINKPFLKRFLEIFRDFYSFLIDEIDYDVPLKRGGKSQRRRTGNKKTRKQHQ